MMIIPPIFCVDPNLANHKGCASIDIFDSCETCEGYIEIIDLVEEDLKFYDSQGMELAYKIEEEKWWIFSLGERFYLTENPYAKPEKERLRTYLKNFFTGSELQDDWLYNATLEEIIEKSKKWMIRNPYHK